jgi:ABC-2 type transport system ATP-binding protein
VISARGLTKRFREGAGIEDLDLAVAPGEIVALVGPNGAGKSTALKLVAGQILPDAGEIRVCGVDLGADPLAAKARMGYLPQEPLLYPYLTGVELLEFVAEVRRERDLTGYLAFCDLGPAAERLTREYSYGMQKRLALAAALMGQPGAILLDEVFAGLDPVASARVAERLREERGRGAAVLLSGHELPSVAGVADRVAVLGAGRLLRIIEAAELMALREEAGGLERAFREITAAGSAATPRPDRAG